MRKFKKLLITGIMAITLCVGGCGTSGSDAANYTGTASDKNAEITIAYQSSVGYAPLIVMKENHLIEEAYAGDINVNWVEMNNGSEINEGLISGSIDVGTMGVPVAITGIQAGSPYRIAFGLSAQPYSILTNSDNINSLADISASDQIAITNINSQPHILLAMAAKAELGDAHALDNNLTVLGNADGYSAIISGAVSCHMVISPYNFMEINNKDMAIHEIEVGNDIWPDENTALVGVVTEKLQKNSPDVYEALLTAIDDAMLYIVENPESTAEILAEGYDASPDEILTWIQDKRSSYHSELHGVMNMADFMVEEGFLENGPSSISELIYENVKGD